jgi:hypothetical protein
MRPGVMVLAAVVMGGCADEARRLDAGRPAIILRLDSLADFEEAQHRADDLCRSHHGYRAQMLHSERGEGADVVTFACVAD